MRVSVLIIACDEAETLPRCLEALSWCDDVILLDSGSTDGTPQIAARYGARVFSRPFDSFAAQRNHGVAAAAPRHPWVLHLDADEVVPPAFRDALAALPEDPDLDGYHVPSKLMLGERWLKRSGGYPCYQARLGHRDRFRFIQVGHGQREAPEARMGVFPEPYLHYAFSHGMRRWLEKHIRYAADEAALLTGREAAPAPEAAAPFSRIGLRRRLKRLFGRAPYWVRPPLRFLQLLILNQGFRDGAAGLAYATMIACYEGMIAVFAYETRLAQRRDARAAPSDRPAPAARQEQQKTENAAP